MHDIVDFLQPLPARWHTTTYGDGQVINQSDELHLTLPASDAVQYHDTQLSDYASKADFRWRPPLRMEVVARCSVPTLSPNPSPNLRWPSAAGRGEQDHLSRDTTSHERAYQKPSQAYPLVGTAGFGFWNHPFVPGERGVRLPKAVWFFFSAPPSNMQLAQGVTGPGWKAATIDTTRWQFLALAPTAPIGLLLMRVPALYQRLWPIGQRAIGVSEKLLDSSLLLERHTYSLDWQPNSVRFAVDDKPIHEATVSMDGPLGFIAWVDNQYAVVTPQGQFKFGVVDIPQPQSLILERVEITPHP